MIIYGHDWLRYPHAIVDTQTKNTSFLRVAKIYREMGISNWMWPLALLNPDLQGVDPFDPDLTEETRLAIFQEASANPIYTLRELTRVPQEGQPEPIRYIANRANMCMTWANLANIDVAIIMPRQNGKSVGADCISNSLINVHGRNSNMQLLTKDHKLRKKNIDSIKAIRDEMPPWAILFDPKGLADADNKEELTCNALKNHLTTAVSRADPEGAFKVGRGLTAATIQNDEGPFCPNIHIALPAAMASSTNSRTLAKQNGTPYGNIFTTTPGNVGTKEGAYMYHLIHSGALWTEAFLDAKDKIDLEDMILKRSRNTDPDKADEEVIRVLINGTFSHRQLGRTDEWLVDVMSNAGGSRASQEADFLNIWQMGAARSPLPDDVKSAIKGSEREPVWTQTSKNNYITEWYRPQAQIDEICRTSFIVAGLDTSNAIGRDANGLVFIDIRTMEVIGCCNVVEANIHYYAKFLANMLIRYPRMLLVPENKSSGQAIIDSVSTYLMAAGENPFKRIFNRLVQEGQGTSDFRELTELGQKIPEEFYIKHKRRFGFMTNKALRSQLYDSVLMAAAKSSGHRVANASLVTQLLALEEINGRIDHPKGGHDDLCFGWLLTHWFVSYGRAHSWYGLPPGVAMSMTTDNGAIMNAEDEAELQRKSVIRERINALTEALEDCDNNLARRTIERRIEMERQKLGSEEDAVVIMETVQDNIEAKPKRTLRDAMLERMMLLK